MSEQDAGKPHKLDYFTPKNGPRRRGALIAVLASCLVLLLFIPYVLNGVNGSRALSSYKESHSRLRQIGQAILLYTNDFNGRYPDSLGDLLLTEDIKSGVFVSPISNDTPAIGPTTRTIVDQLAKAGHVSYIYLGKGLSKSIVTPDTIVAYEQLSDDPTEVNTLFGDGHVEWLDSSVAAKIAAQAASGKRPVRIPGTY